MIYLVNQGKTYNQERAGGFLWSPKLNNAGKKNAGYLLMTKVKKGDYILHNSGGKIASISIVKRGCYDAKQPIEIKKNSGNYTWNDDGYRVDTNYYDFETPLINSSISSWAKLNSNGDSCFQSNGKIKLRYLCDVSNEDAKYIINQLLLLEKVPLVRNILYDVLFSLNFDKDEYNNEDIEIINNIVDTQTDNVKNYSGRLRKIQAMILNEHSCKYKPKRDPQVAANALKNANYVCEYNQKDRTFLRKSNKSYTEPHHLIPISKYNDFSYSVDVEENIVSLCSHCHNLLHYGRIDDKEKILRKLYNERITYLIRSGLELTFEQLMLYYK